MIASRASSPRTLGRVLVTIAFLGSVIGGVGAPLITSVSVNLAVPLDAAQWSLTATLFSGAISAPVLGRLGTGPHRRTSLIVTLALVAAGGLLTVLPFPFAALLIGRVLQGLGLGTVALLMSVARDHLPEDLAASTISTISVAGTVGIGVSYPLMGLLDQVAGLRVAYGVGFILSVFAMAIAVAALPKDLPRPRAAIDISGAALLGVGILAVLLAVSQPSIWNSPWAGATAITVAAISLGLWIKVEQRTATPLVDLSLLTNGGIVRANLAMLFAGVGMYLLFSLLTRFVQTPADANYGFGLSGVVAGAALIPFSVLGFVSGRLTPRLAAVSSQRSTFVAFSMFVIIGASLFALAPGQIAVVLLSMSSLGFGVGGVSAIMPRLVLNDVPSGETSSVLSVNQIVRTVGFSLGSALAGLLLATFTSAGAHFPDESGYSTAAWIVIPFVFVSVVFVLVRRGSRPIR